MKPYSNTKHDPLLKRLKKLFKDNPEKSTIVLKEKCSDCGIEIFIEITRTSVGFGLMGGVLFKSSNDKLKAKCLTCSKKLFKIEDNQKNGK
jgi:DNA-directed RNA polymerase subunit RPC12/RpoP